MDDLQAKIKMIAKARSEGGREKLRIKIGIHIVHQVVLVSMYWSSGPLFIIQLVNWPTLNCALSS